MIRAPVDPEAPGLAEALLGLSWFRVLDASETEGEVVIDIESTAELVRCTTCGTRAEAQDRMVVEIRDLACFGRAARLVWHKRRWRCIDPPHNQRQSTVQPTPAMVRCRCTSHGRHE